MLQEDPIVVCQGLKGAYRQEGDRLFKWSDRNRTRENDFKLQGAKKAIRVPSNGIEAL